MVFAGVAFMGGVLVQFWGDPFFDQSAQFAGAKTVGEPDHAEIVNDRIQYVDCEIMQRGIAVRFFGQIGQAAGFLGFPAFDQLPVGQVRRLSR